MRTRINRVKIMACNLSSKSRGKSLEKISYIISKNQKKSKNQVLNKHKTNPQFYHVPHTSSLYTTPSLHFFLSQNPFRTALNRFRDAIYVLCVQ